MADIRKRVGQNGIITYQLRYPKPGMPGQYAFRTFDTKKAANAFLLHIGSIEAPIETNIKTVHHAVHLWLKTCEKIGRDGRETVEPLTLKEYKRRAAVMEEYDWPKAIQDVDSTDVVRFRNWLLEYKSRDLARRTLSSFHSVLIEMNRQGHIKGDPAAGVFIPRSGRYEDYDSELRVPSDAEVRALLDAADRLANSGSERVAASWRRYRPMIYLAVFSGMRPSEYRGLAWPHVGNDFVTVRQRADRTGRLGPVKSKASKRTIFLPRAVVELIEGWHPYSAASPDDLVFPAESGRPQLLSNFYHRAWLPLLEEAGLMVAAPGSKGKTKKPTPKYPLYALRHYFASKLIEQGRDLKFIQQVMGHSKIEVTFDVYGHLLKGNEELYKKEAESLLAVIRG